jgi:hypothetical protein
MKMLRKSIAALLGLLLTSSGIAFAQNPHFVGTPKASLTADFAVAVQFKEAGLGSNQKIDYLVSATASGSCACVTHSGNCPNAANKFPPTEVSGQGSFTSGKNGSISATVTTDVPDCLTVSPSSCPNGQTNTLVSISYSDIAITDTTTPVGPVATSPNSLAATNIFTCP